MSLSQEEQDRAYWDEQERKKKEIAQQLELSNEAVENLQQANQAHVTKNQAVTSFDRPDLLGPDQLFNDGQDLEQAMTERRAQLQQSLDFQQQAQQMAAQQLQQQQAQQSAQHQAQQQANLQATLQAKADSDRQAQQQHQDRQAQLARQAEQQKPGQDTPQVDHQRAQTASPERQESHGYSSPASSPGRGGQGGGNVWGADNQINEKWRLHEAEQADLQKTITSMKSDIEVRQARGEDVSLDSTKLQMSQNQYAINHHEMSARSFSQTAAYAKATSIGGQHDTQSYDKAQSMRDHHTYQAEQLREQQAKLLEQVKLQQEQKQQQDQQNQQQEQAKGQSPADKARDLLNQNNQAQPDQQPQLKGPGMEDSNTQSATVHEIKEARAEKAPEKAYDPNDRVRAAEARGQALKQEAREEGKTVTADDTKSLSQQNTKSKEIEQSQAESKQKDQDKGKQLSR